MKILMIVKALHYSYAGGIQTHVRKLSQALIKRGHEVTVITAQNIMKSKIPFEDEGLRIIPVSYLPAHFRFFHFLAIEELSFNLFVYFKIRKLLSQDNDRFDVVHIQGRNGFLYPLFRNANDPPAVATFHGLIKDETDNRYFKASIPVKRRVELFLIKLYSPLIEKIVAIHSQILISVSKQMTRNLQRRLDIDPRKVNVIYNGLDIDEFYPDKKKRIPFRILAVARLDPRKGLTYLVEAVHQLADEFPKMTVHIVGDGEQRLSLEQLVREKQLDDKIRLMGNRHGNELLKEYQQASLFVLPTLRESQGIVFLEAMSAEIPVIGFKIGGVDEMIDDGEEGFLVEKEDVPELVQSIRTLINDSATALKMGVNGRRKVELYFQWERIAEKTEQVYYKVLQGSYRLSGALHPREEHLEIEE